jgi:hypothetical protein
VTVAVRIVTLPVAVRAVARWTDVIVLFVRRAAEGVLGRLRGVVAVPVAAL